MQGFSSAFQQALIDIQCAVHLVSQKPGCVIERRFFFYSAKKLRVIRIHFPDVFKHLLPGESPGHGGEVIAAVKAFYQTRLRVIQNLCVILLQTDLLSGAALLSQKLNDLLCLITDRKIFFCIVRIFDDIVQEAGGDERNEYSDVVQKEVGQTVCFFGGIICICTTSSC
jgi:hypothetical protein